MYKPPPCPEWGDQRIEDRGKYRSEELLKHTHIAHLKKRRVGCTFGVASVAARALRPPRCRVSASSDGEEEASDPSVRFATDPYCLYVVYTCIVYM